MQWAGAWGKHINVEELLKWTWCEVQLARDGDEGAGSLGSAVEKDVREGVSGELLS